MRKVEYKIYESDEDCAWVIEQCLKNCVVNIGVAYNESKESCRVFSVNIQGQEHFFPRSVARALTYIFVEAVHCKIENRFHEVFNYINNLFNKTMDYTNFHDELIFCCKDFIQSFRDQENTET